MTYLNFHRLFIHKKASLLVTLIRLPIITVTAILLSPFSAAQSDDTPLTLSMAVERAIALDPWRTGNELQRKSLVAKSKSIERLPDPRLSFALVNAPVDGFSLDQEPMTQMKIGITQAFHRGDSQPIRRKYYQQRAKQHPYLEQDRIAKVSSTVSKLWFDAFYAQRSLALINAELNLFKQLAETVQSQYATGHDLTKQDDVIRSQLELSRLSDRQTQASEQYVLAKSKLTEWLVSEIGLINFSIPVNRQRTSYSMEEKMTNQSSINRTQDLMTISAHPAVKAVEQRVRISQVEVELAKQKYKPQWGLNASYARRQDDEAGQSRADFFSVGISLDIPLFNQGFTDNDVSARTLNAEALKTEKRLIIRKMLAQLHARRNQLQQVLQRIELFESSILPQLHEQAETSLMAYTNSEREFAEVMRARIAEFDGRMELIEIHLQRDRILSEISYFTQHNWFNKTKGANHE